MLCINIKASALHDLQAFILFIIKKQLFCVIDLYYSQNLVILQLILKQLLKKGRTPCECVD